MTRLCAVTICPNHKLKTETVHRFPAENQPHKRKTWEAFVALASGGKPKINFEYYGICSNHFNDVDFQDDSKRLKTTAIPTNILGEYLQIIFVMEV